MADKKTKLRQKLAEELSKAKDVQEYLKILGNAVKKGIVTKESAQASYEFKYLEDTSKLEYIASFIKLGELFGIYEQPTISTPQDLQSGNVLSQFGNEGREVYKRYAQQNAPFDYYNLSEEQKEYVNKFYSREDLLNRLYSVGIPVQQASEMADQFMLEVNQDQLNTRKQIYEIEQNIKRGEIYNRLSKTVDPKEINDLLGEGYSQGLISEKEAQNYLSQFQQGMGGFQQSLTPVLDELYNSPYLTPEDFEAYREDEGVMRNDPTAIKVMINTLNQEAMRRQEREQEEQTLAGIIQYESRPMSFAPQYAQAPDAYSMLQGRVDASQYAPGSRLQSLLTSEMGRIGEETAEERARHFSQTRPMTYEELLSEYNYRANRLENRADYYNTTGLADMARQEAEKYRTQLGQMQPSDFVNPVEWEQQMLAGDPLKREMDKFDLDAAYRKLTQSQRGQNVSRFAPSVRFR